MSETVTFATEITDLSEKKLGDKQMRLAVALAEMFEARATAPPAMMAVRVIDLIREFNAAERRAKQGQPVTPKPPTVPVNPLVEKLARLIDQNPLGEDEQGLSLAIAIIKEMAGVE